jgi:hypothetical protein
VYELLWLTRLRHCFSGTAVDANRLTVILFAIFVPIMRIFPPQESQVLLYK